MTDKEIFVIKFMKYLAKMDLVDYINWDEELNTYVQCNDAFYWACADSVEITEEDFEDFKKAFEEAEFDGPLLYCARKRKMRPQGAMYKYIDKEHQHLFDECGEAREAGIGNPVHRM